MACAARSISRHNGGDLTHSTRAFNARTASSCERNVSILSCHTTSEHSNQTLAEIDPNNDFVKSSEPPDRLR